VPKVADSGGTATQFEEDAGRSERSTGVEIGVGEHPNAPREGPVEAAQHTDLVIDHDY
jgi:hypothetical protein